MDRKLTISGWSVYDQFGFVSVDEDGMEYADEQIHILTTHEGRTVFRREYDATGKLCALTGSLLAADHDWRTGPIVPPSPIDVSFYELSLLQLDGSYEVIARYQDERVISRVPVPGDVIVGGGERYRLLFDSGDPFSSPEEAWAYVSHYFERDFSSGEEDSDPSDELRVR